MSDTQATEQVGQPQGHDLRLLRIDEVPPWLLAKMQEEAEEVSRDRVERLGHDW